MSENNTPKADGDFSPDGKTPVASGEISITLEVDVYEQTGEDGGIESRYIVVNNGMNRYKGIYHDADSASHNYWPNIMYDVKRRIDDIVG